MGAVRTTWNACTASGAPAAFVRCDRSATNGCSSYSVTSSARTGSPGAPRRRSDRVRPRPCASSTARSPATSNPAPREAMAVPSRRTASVQAEGMTASPCAGPSENVPWSRRTARRTRPFSRTGPPGPSRSRTSGIAYPQAAGGAYEVHLGREAGALTVGVHHLSLEGFQRLLSHEVDGAAAEPRAGQARAQHALYARGQIHQQVGLRAGGLEVVPQALVRFVEQAAQGPEIAAAEGAGGGRYPRPLPDHVASPAGDGRRQV